MSSSKSLSILCARCNRRLKAPSKLTGKTLPCPACGAPVLVQDDEYIEPLTLGEAGSANGDGQRPPLIPTPHAEPPQTGQPDTAPEQWPATSQSSSPLIDDDEEEAFDWRSGRRRRSFWAAFVHAIDPMFERYLTPWIIRMTWGIVILLGLLGVSLSGSWLHRVHAGGTFIDGG